MYDGGSKGSPELGKYSGTSLPPIQISSSNVVYIHFHTDDRDTKKGFKLEYHPYSKYF